MLVYPAYSITFGFAVVVIGLGSFFYHASLTFAGQWFDVMGMYLLMSFAVLYRLASLYPFGGARFALIYGAANVTLGAFLIGLPQYRREMFAAFVLAVLALELLNYSIQKSRIRMRYFLAALASFGVAYAIWLLDNLHIWCVPEGWLQGHAVWHVLTAGAAGLLYLYYRSEVRSLS
jgi:hypothetical protein